MSQPNEPEDQQPLQGGQPEPAAPSLPLESRLAGQHSPGRGSEPEPAEEPEAELDDDFEETGVRYADAAIPERPPFRDGGGADEPPRYPMRFDIEYPQRLSRWKTLLRGFLIIPALIFASGVNSLVQAAFTLGWATVFLRRKYPTWLFHAGGGGLAFSARVFAYGLLLTDHYPSFSSPGSTVQLDFPDPPDGRLSRWRVFFWKLLLLVPHFIVLGFLFIAVFAVTVIAWFAILITGRYPRGLFGFVTGVMRWSYRTQAYFASYNDRFPPFALSESAAPGSRTAAVVSGITGAVLAGGFVTLVGVVAAVGEEQGSARLSYDDLARGVGSPRFYTGSESNPTFTVRLDRVEDPAPEALPLVDVSGSRVVVFEWTLSNDTRRNQEVEVEDVRFRYSVGDRERVRDATLVLIDGDPSGVIPRRSGPVIMQSVFVIPEDALPVQLRFSPPWPAIHGVKLTFR